jgi:hypothetical protein
MSGKELLTMFGFVGIFILGLMTGISVESFEFERRAVKAGVAQFNPRTAAFEWIESKQSECDYVTEVHNQMIMNRLNNQKCE